jgi:CheY-like chemotaxis protein
MRLLYVDDDRINTLLFQETCRLSPGLEVRTAPTGHDAIAVARDFQPDVLVIDLHLPDTDGYGLLAQLREVAGLATKPAFLCTADLLDAVAEPAARAGYCGCWNKPVQLPGMLAALAQCAAVR